MMVHANGDGKSEDKLPTKQKKIQKLYSIFIVFFSMI